MRKKGICAVLCIALVIAMIPAGIFAGEPGGNSDSENKAVFTAPQGGQFVLDISTGVLSFEGSGRLPVSFPQGFSAARYWTSLFGNHLKDIRTLYIGPDRGPEDIEGLKMLCSSVSFSEINADINNPYFKSENGILYDKATSEALIYPVASSGSDTPVIPEITDKQDSDKKDKDITGEEKENGDQPAVISPAGKDVNDKAESKTERIRNGVKKTTVKLKSSRTDKGITLTWKKSEGYKVDGYEIYRSQKKNRGYERKALVKASKGKYRDTRNLKSGKKYYYKVRGYRTIDGRKVYTRWSDIAYRTYRQTNR